MSAPTEGTHIVLNGDTYIKVSEKKITADNIRPKIEIIKGRKLEDGQVEQVQNATLPKFRTDLPERIQAFLKTQGFSGVKVYKDAVEEEADQKLLNLIKVVAQVAGTIPMTGYSKTYIYGNGRIGDEYAPFETVTTKELSNFFYKDEELHEYPFRSKTHILAINDNTVQPYIYWDQMLQEGDKIYEIYAHKKTGDVGRFQLYEVYKALSQWTYKSGPKKGQTEEVMAVIQPVYLQGGSTQEYIALIAPKRILTKEGEEKFVLVMKLCQAAVKYSNAMMVPKEGEVPILPEAQQQTAVSMASFSDLLEAVAA